MASDASLLGNSSDRSPRGVQGLIEQSDTHASDVSGHSGSPEGEDEVTLVSDGACSGNPGPGGWGCLLRFRGRERELTGGEVHTTNNRMELLAVINGLEALKRPVSVEVITDSKYVLDGATKFLPGWMRNGWRLANKSPVKNADLWMRLEQAARPHRVRWTWVRGHNGHVDNERVDALARGAMPKP